MVEEEAVPACTSITIQGVNRSIFSLFRFGLYCSGVMNYFCAKGLVGNEFQMVHTSTALLVKIPISLEIDLGLWDCLDLRREWANVVSL